MRNKLVLAASFLLIPPAAAAHVTLTETGAAPGKHLVLHFRVGHGCDGAPTTALRITIPDAITDADPAPAPGWTLETRRDGSHVRTVTWTGGSLAPTVPSEFAVAMTMPTISGQLLFAALQSCGATTEDWSEAPAADGHKLKNPAPHLLVSATPVAGMQDTISGMAMPH